MARRSAVERKDDKERWGGRGEKLQRREEEKIWGLIRSRR